MTRALPRPAPNQAKDRAKDTPSRSSRTPRELREVLASPGHPIDPGLRRELESRLGHDFSRVRVHTDPDAAAMTELLGADAVTVGQDVFFARDAFRPETADGKRLLVHELLHTIQVPHAPGALREGRDSGAVSLPVEPVEREAERIARSDRTEQPVERGQQNASWLRYATVDANRMRTEQLDPATLVDRLVGGVLRSLRGDPTDLSGRIRLQLSRFTPELRTAVLIRLERRLPSSEYAKVLELVEKADQAAAGGPVESSLVPVPVVEDEPEPQEPDPPEPQPGEPEAQEPEPQEPEPPEPEVEPEPEPDVEPRKPEEEQEQEPEPEEGSDQEEEEKKDPEPAPEEAPADQPAAAQEPGAPGAQPAAGQGPPAGAAPMPEGGTATPEPAEARPEKVEEAAQAPDSPLVLHGLEERDDRLEEQEEPVGLDPAAEVDVPEPEEPAAEEGEREEPPLKPEDHLPATDLDVSSVPTADQITLPASGSPPPQQEAPSFPGPPPTKAEQAEPEDAEPSEEIPAEQPLDAEVGPEPTEDAPAPPAAAIAKPEPEQVETAAPEPVAPEPEAVETAAPQPVAPEPVAPEPVGAEPVAEPEPAAGPGSVGAATAAPETAEEPDLGAGVAPEASLEKDGGGCGGAPMPAEPAAGAACGGGGGAPAADQQQPPPPDVSAQPPEAALATAATLPPDKMQTSLAGVDSAVSGDVGKQQAALQAAPPTVERPSGAPRTLSGPPVAAPPGEFEKIELEQAEATRAEQQRKAEAKQVEGQNQAGQAPRPHVAGDQNGKMSEQEVRDVQQAVDNVPTTDPALNTNVGAAPKVELTGEQDPARTDEQAGELQQATTTMHSAGTAESAKPLGEDQIFPNAPAQALTAQVPGAEGGGPGVQAPGADTNPGVAVVAQQERGPQIQAGVGEGQARMGAERQTKEQGDAEANANHQAEVSRAVAENSQAQAEERGKVAQDVAVQREEWRTEQDEEAEESNTEAGKEHEKSKTGIQQEKTDADKKTEERRKEDDDKIRREREAAEDKARKEKEAKQEESDGGGFFSWIASKVKSFFEGLLNAITKIFDAAVALVNGIIKTFASIVTGLIDLARDAIVGLINALADVLLKLCDVLAVFFPELAARMRKGIEQLRDAAIAAVNELADALKAGVEFLLNKLAEALTGLLRLLEKGLKAAVEIVRSAVNAAIEFAKAAIQLLGEFAAIIADIAAIGVGPWLGKLGSAAVEGIQKYLWDAIKTGVRKWFNEKVESILGLGKTVFDVLVKGCFSMAKIGKMVWDALIAALPMMIVAVVVERLVSLIVPAAGAVLAVVQGLMAAWGTISRILAAIGAFIAFVKAVRAGPAACLFATAVAAGVVALLEFITNFLMAKLAGAAKGVGGALKGIAKKIMKGLARAGRGARKAAGKAVNAARQGLRKVGAALKPKPGRPRARRSAKPTRLGRPARPGARTPSPKSRLSQAKAAVASGVRKVATTLKKVGKKVANSKLGKALKNTAKKARDKYRKARDRWKAKARQRQDAKKKRDQEKNSEGAKKRRLELIIAKIEPKVTWLLRRGVRQKLLNTVLHRMRAWYRLTQLTTEKFPQFRVLAILNPRGYVKDGVYYDFAGEEVSRLGDAVRRFNSNQEAEDYGEAVLRPILKQLPLSQRKAIEEYTWWSYPYNKVSRGADPRKLLQDWEKDRGKRAPLLDLFKGRTPTLREVVAASKRIDLTPKQRKIVDRIVNSEDPRKQRRKELAQRGLKDRMTKTFGGRFPAEREFAERMSLMDQALANPLPEGIEVQRTLADVDFMDTTTGAPGNPKDLEGTTQKEQGYMSTSLGVDSAFNDFERSPYRVHLDLPKGAHALWVGQLSKYSEQREVILPRNTKYRITRVDGPKGVKVKSGKLVQVWDIYATVIP